MLDTLQAHVKSLNRELFTVKMELEHVQEYSDRVRWNRLGTADIFNIRGRLVPLIPGDDEPEASKRFDLLMLKLQRAFVLQEQSRRRYEKQVTDIAGKLQRKNNIPAVAAKLGLIQRILEPKFWQGINVKLLEHIRGELRDLLIYLDKEEKAIVYTNFEDEIAEVQEREIVKPYREMESYKKRVERYIRENKHHVTISKLRHNQAITVAELQQLERILFDGQERGTKEDFARESNNQPLGVFIRSILGMDRSAAMEAFSVFLQNANLSADQIRFIDYIINYFETNGYLDKAKLFEPPFTDLNDQSVFGIFQNGEAGKVISIIEGVNSNAEVA